MLLRTVFFDGTIAFGNVLWQCTLTSSPSFMPKRLDYHRPESAPQEASRRLALLNELEGAFFRNLLLFVEPERMEKFDREFQHIFGVQFRERKQLRAVLEGAVQSESSPDRPDVNGSSSAPVSSFPEAWR